MKLFNPAFTDKQINSFWKKVIIKNSSTCWEWRASLIGEYGKYALGLKALLAHRVSYFIANGVFDNSLFVLHSCDNPKCVNPRHLFLGTQKDNIDDMISKGRQAIGNKVSNKGEYNGQAKLTEIDVAQIKEKYASGQYTQTELGTQYGVNQRTISLVVCGKKWKHLINNLLN